MGSPQPWPPYPALKDCSQGYCSYYCPQWCYFLFPPPSPSPPSKHTLSPLLIAVISMLSTAFLLTAYYVILSKFRRRFQSSPPSAFRSPLASAQNDTPSVSQGLDETLINKIASCQYRPSEGLVADGTDCSVCLGQFEDGERLRLLPQCDHAFHLRCIDTWLRAHSTCPLCRASIVVSAVPPTTNPEPNRIVESTPTVVVVESESTSPDTIEIREEGSRFFGRSFSMDSPFRRQVSTSTSSGGSSRWNRALHCIMSPVRMKRSLSGYTRQVGRGRTAVLPI